MIIREAKAFEALQIANIHTTSWRETYQDALSANYLADIVPQEREEVWKDRLEKPKNNQYVVVAEVDDLIVGFACFYAGENLNWGSYLDNLHVLKEYQSKGIGKALLIQGYNWCSKQEAVSGLCLLVNQDNIKAQRLYQRLGAYKAEVSSWNAPDGSVVPTYWFVWDKINDLVNHN